ncbi:MAG: lysostaphin resistance A-like protein [Actinomycetota bacterium]
MSVELPPRPDLVRLEPARSRLRSVPWGPLEAIPVFVIALLLTVIGGIPVGLIVASGGSRFVWWALVNELGFLGAVVLWVRVVRRSPLGALGMPRRPLRDIGVGLLAGGGLVVVGWIAGIVVVLVAQLILGHPPAQPEQIPSDVEGPNLLLSGFVVVLAAPLGEEVFFRGFLFQGLRRRFAVWPAALISAALFALVHISPLLIFALFPIGVGLAWIYERRQSVLASMAAHALFNLVGMLTIALTR